MAEFVQRHLEELLPAFTGLQRTKILSDEEVKTLIQKVRQFEYCVNKRVSLFFKFIHKFMPKLPCLDKTTKRLSKICRIFE